MPILGPLVGGLIGAFLYDLLVGRNLPAEDEEQPPGRVPAQEPAGRPSPDQHTHDHDGRVLAGAGVGTDHTAASPTETRPQTVDSPGRTSSHG